MHNMDLLSLMNFALAIYEVLVRKSILSTLDVVSVFLFRRGMTQLWSRQDPVFELHSRNYMVGCIGGFVPRS